MHLLMEHVLLSLTAPASSESLDKAHGPAEQMKTIQQDTGPSVMAMCKQRLQTPGASSSNHRDGIMQQWHGDTKQSLHRSL